MGAQRVGVKAGVFLGGVGVNLAAEQIGFHRNVHGGQALRPLKRHVLDKVGGPVFPRRLVLGAATHPDAEGGRTEKGNGLEYHRQSILQRLLFHRNPPFLR